MTDARLGNLTIAVKSLSSFFCLKPPFFPDRWRLLRSERPHVSLSYCCHDQGGMPHVR